MKYEKLRRGQQSAINTLLDRIADKSATTSIVLPTRYGKSDVIRLASFLCKQEKTASGSLVFSPSEILRNQLVSPDKVLAMVDRYGLPYETGGPSKVRLMTDAYEYQAFPNDEYLLSATVQLATRNIDAMASLAEHCRDKFGAPLLVHIDECHETSEQKKRGLLVSKLTNAGALVVLYTATAVRADGEVIPGFEVEVLSEEESVRYECHDTQDPEIIRVDKFTGIKRLVRLRADHETTFRQAWDEKPSPLCNLSREVVDVEIQDKNGEMVMLSTCSKSKASDLLGKAVRHPEVVRKGVQRMLAELTTRRRVNPACAAMVFTCSDDGETANAHAKQVLEEINSQQAFSSDPLDAVIVTMKTEEGDEKASKAIERFGQGRGDILIVKQMGGAGLDIGRLKVLLDLSSQRTVASVIQRLMRVATPWEGLNTGTVITLSDANMEAIWSRYVVEEGGEEDPNNSIYEDELTESYQKEREQRPDAESAYVTGAELKNFDDNNGAVADANMAGALEKFLQDFPWATNHMTKAELAQKIALWVTGGSTDDAPQKDTPLEQQIGGLRKSILRERDEKIKKVMLGRYDRAEWGKLASKIMTDAYIEVGTPKGTTLEQIKSVETLNRIFDILCRAN